MSRTSLFLFFLAAVDFLLRMDFVMLVLVLSLFYFYFLFLFLAGSMAKG